LEPVVCQPVNQIAERCRGLSVKVQTRVVVRSHIASAILEEAQNEFCDLIALAMHGRTGIKRLLLGSVCDKVLRGATCPVLVYRDPG
jgi:nucleotide-binding universal stress UspA family protein